MAIPTNKNAPYNYGGPENRIPAAETIRSEGKFDIFEATLVDTLDFNNDLFANCEKMRSWKTLTQGSSTTWCKSKQNSYAEGSNVPKNVEEELQAHETTSSKQ